MNDIHGASLDRFDNDNGYVDGNIQIVVIPINTALKPPNDVIQKLREEHWNKDV